MSNLILVRMNYTVIFSYFVSFLYLHFVFFVIFTPVFFLVISYNFLFLGLFWPSGNCLLLFVYIVLLIIVNIS